MQSFLLTEQKKNCCGCEACIQVCGHHAIRMIKDDEGFSYPKIDETKCTQCGLCVKVCMYTKLPEKYHEEQYAYGGYHRDKTVRLHSTSGGAFTAIVDIFCDENYVIFGAVAHGLYVYHEYIMDKAELDKFRKSKYIQSHIGASFKNVKSFLRQGKKVLFSGTPCQIAGLKKFLSHTDQTRLLTVEVICEGVPSPRFVESYNKHMIKRYGAGIKTLDYRYKNKGSLENPILGKWDFEVMYTSLQNHLSFTRDRWFNPFWSIWLNHLMSRPSCYQCPFTTSDRVADITLGDLWGVHKFSPELYGHNGGASLIICNTEKGKNILKAIDQYFYGHPLDFATVLKYQGPLRKSIADNPLRDLFFADIKRLSFSKLCSKWAIRPSIRLLISKYIYGNQHKVFLWNILRKFKNKNT